MSLKRAALFFISVLQASGKAKILMLSGSGPLKRTRGRLSDHLLVQETSKTKSLLSFRCRSNKLPSPPPRSPPLTLEITSSPSENRLKPVVLDYGCGLTGSVSMNSSSGRKTPSSAMPPFPLETSKFSVMSSLIPPISSIIQF
ncbi:hypothetical protein MTR_5g078235 [Medicago truncatula]|uniref:Uncharacterized protein n=1 Tax=Medicago truncatula TaxID=3880 RepID=A0A072UEY5_MEDTR|nr:hypothetical protein MTR_5g078235 [Medicago truncatula]